MNGYRNYGIRIYKGILINLKKNKEILLLATTWVDLEDMLSETSQSQGKYGIYSSYTRHLKLSYV